MKMFIVLLVFILLFVTSCSVPACEKYKESGNCYYEKCMAEHRSFKETEYVLCLEKRVDELKGERK